ncbi:MAG TPA: C1 family peptidase [Fimbriimonadaceae bacterium]|nr:C1 family peptidase [Fimbriimonadaceae bacterium]
MLALALLGLVAFPDLPKHVDLRSTYERFGLSVCRQNGPLCWDYTVVGLLEYELAKQRRAATRLSPGFLSWAASATDSESHAGSNFGRAYRGLEKYGIAPLDLGGDPDGNGVGHVPDAGTLEAASKIGRIEVRWIRFWNNRDPLSEDQLRTIESEIAHGHPVAVGMRWPNRTGFSPPGSYVLSVPDPSDVFDGHCVALVGYQLDSKYPGGGAFLFRNSWGEGWADHGYAWMPFGLLSFCINDSLSLRVEPPLNPAGPGTLEFQAADLSPVDVAGPTPIARRRQLYFPATKKGERFGLDLAVEKAGVYEARLIVTRAQDYGLFRAGINGVDAEIDGSGPGISRSNPLPLGKIRLRKGANRIVFTAIGHDSASTGFAIGLNAIQLVPSR